MQRTVAASAEPEWPPVDTASELASLRRGVAIAPDSPWKEIVAVLFGIGTGLTLDEFALWLDLKDVYWSAQGRRSIDAVVVAAALSGIVLVGYNAWIDVADKYLGLGLWEEAGNLLDRVFRRNPASLAQRAGHSWHLHALFRNAAADEAGFRASCAEFWGSDVEACRDLK